MTAVVKRIECVTCVLALLATACSSSDDASQPGESHTREADARPGWIDRSRLMDANREPGSWLTSGRDFGFQHYSPLTAIDTDTVTELGFAWEYRVARHRGRVHHAMETTPVYVDGVLYGSGPWGSVYAVDAASGGERWRYDPEITPGWARRTCCAPVNRGVAVWEGLVYVGTLDGYLVALDADTGDVAWRVDTFVDREPYYSITGAPFIAGDNVVIGNSGAEFGVRGYITAYDTATGELAWRFYTVPGDPANGFEHPELEAAAKTWSPDSAWESGGGGTVWGHMAWDPELNLLYVGTGNGSPWPAWHRSPGGGDNLYLSTILALEPKTGRLAWHYQTTPGDSWDYTATQHMVLAELEIDGRSRKVLMQAPKNGFFYVLDRETGELLSADNYIHVNWASHVDPDTGRPVLTAAANYREQARIIFPSPFGGHSWMPMAFSPDTGLVYIPITNRPGLFTSADAYEFDPAGWSTAQGNAPEDILAEFSSVYEEETREELIAWDPVAQQAAWRVPRGKGMLHNGGTLATAGGLVVQGTARGFLEFHDAATGEALHSIETGTGIMAAPMSYELDGEQYIAVMAGYGATRAGDFAPDTAPHRYQNVGRILAFRLGGGATPMPPPATRTAVPEPPERRGTAEQIAAGEALFMQYCIMCHEGFGDAVSAYPKLDRMPAATHAAFSQIVLDGALSGAGMAGFADTLSEADAEAIHAYLTDLQHELFEKSEAGGAGE